uniref:glutamine--fructose-6-phosphate transaminase (isomerizing) n=1 Tax=Neolamprologus brichardi TaxID=32507 RepID=A0A3Q4HBT5_NEOBR
MCGIFAYLNYQVPRTRKEIFETLVKGLQRLEYRGYDSAGETLNFTVTTHTPTPTHVYTRTTDAFSSPWPHLYEIKETFHRIQYINTK